MGAAASWGFFKAVGNALIAVPKEALTGIAEFGAMGVDIASGNSHVAGYHWDAMWERKTSIFTSKGASDAWDSVSEKFTPSYYKKELDGAVTLYGNGKTWEAGEKFGETAFEAANTASMVYGGARVLTSLGGSALRTTGNVLNRVAPKLNPANYVYRPAISMNGLGGKLRYVGPKVHGNSLNYVGDTHVYVIRGPNGIHKVGESMRGVRAGDGASIRGEAQARALNRKVGPGHYSDIRKWFPDKASARAYETRLIERYRRMWGQDNLPGNKGNR